MGSYHDQIIALMGATPGANPFTDDSVETSAAPTPVTMQVPIPGNTIAETPVENRMEMTTETRLPFEIEMFGEPEPARSGPNRRPPRRAAAPTKMPGVGPPIRAVARKASRAVRKKRARSPEEESEEEQSSTDSDDDKRLDEARKRLQCTKRQRQKRVKRVPQSDSESEDSEVEAVRRKTKGKQVKYVVSPVS
jgi:hypothetical protein